VIELTIDGKKIRAPKGTTILKAALDNDIHIPHLCWDRRLEPFGGCRLCIVEVEGKPKYQAACSTPAENGMVVLTDTEAIKKSRQTVLDLLLTHHPLDCPICDKAGECRLQDLAYAHGPSRSTFSGEKRHDVEETGSPFIERNPNRCIMCGRCVRVCWQHQGVGAINFIGRGFDTKISPAFEETLNCEFCGQCVDACPVGALGSKPYKYRTRAWFLDYHDNICPYCSVGCTISLGVREGRITNARGVDFKGINKGDLCGKGRYGIDFIYSESRLKTPLIREGGELVKRSWEEALVYVGNRLEEIIKTKGPGKVGALGSPRCTIEDNYMLQKFMRTVVGTNNIDSSARFGFAKVQKAVEAAFGLTNLPIGIDSPLGKEVVLVTESDITATHPIWGLKFIEAARAGTKLIVIDPRETKLAKHAGIWLRPRPGTSGIILNGIMHLAISQGLHLKSEAAAAVGNFRAVEEPLQRYTPDMVADAAGIDKADFLSAAREFLKAKSRLVAVTLVAAENNKGLSTILAAANLVMLTGDGPSALQVPSGYSNTFGAMQMGISPYMLPGYKKITENPGLGVTKMLYEKGAVNALYIMGEDPMVTYPRLDAVEGVLKGLDLLIVQDIRLTETAKLAHIVLPAASWAEKDGMFINSSGMSQYVRKIVQPAGEAMADWKILRNLARVMHVSIGTDELSSIRKEISSIEVLKGSEKWNYVPVHPGIIEKTDAEYPIAMVTGNLMQHSGSLTSMSRSLAHVYSDAFVQVNDADAQAVGISDGGMMRIESRRGSAVIKARLTDEIIRGMVFAPVHLFQARLNSLTYETASDDAPLTAVRIGPA
jgi:formate dehydrogenase alpha subunit